MIAAQVVCDSISVQEHRPLTFKLRYPKFIHGEFMTHRLISRNASSSRAIPTSKLIEEVRSDALRAGPVFWGANQKGMQAVEELSDDHYQGTRLSPRMLAQNYWKDAALEAMRIAEVMVEIGVHKQIVNRLLEPFSHINVVATATEWDNFFGLRLHRDAQPEMRALAVAMWEARKASTPRLLRPGEWHLPFVDGDDGKGHPITWDEKLDDIQVAIKVSVARCARVSYESFETGKRSTVEEDLRLYDRLLGAQPLHASPAEHQATPDIQEWVTANELGPQWLHLGEHGNLVGWRQYRKMLPNEAVAPLPEGYS